MAGGSFQNITDICRAAAFRPNYWTFVQLLDAHHPMSV
jgi:hypothetical protein